jgi:hypothetical protein
MISPREDYQKVNLTEYVQLRDEINNRTQLSAGLVSLNLAALGAGLTVITNIPDIVVALAAISSFLWLLWIDHTSQIYKIAAYIGLRLAPRLREGTEETEKLLDWEKFMRTLDQGGQTAATALFGSSLPNGVRPEKVRMLRTETIAHFVSLLFGISPPLLIAGFVIAEYRKLSDWTSLLSLRGAILILALFAWIYATKQYFRFVNGRKSIDQALLGAPEPSCEHQSLPAGTRDIREGP